MGVGILSASAGAMLFGHRVGGGNPALPSLLVGVLRADSHTRSMNAQSMRSESVSRFSSGDAEDTVWGGVSFASLPDGLAPLASQLGTRDASPVGLAVVGTPAR